MMVVQAEQDRVKHLLTEALPMLCKNGLSFSSEFCIEALIGITLDKNDVFLVSIKETVKSENDGAAPEKAIDISVSKVSQDVEEPKASSRRKQHRKRRRSRASPRDSDTENDLDDSEGHTDVKREKMESIGFGDEFNGTHDSSTNDDLNNRTVQESSSDAVLIKEEPIESDYNVSFGDMGGHDFDMTSYAHGAGDYSQSSSRILHKPGVNPLSPSNEQTLPGTSYSTPDAGQKEDGHSKDSQGSMFADLNGYSFLAEEPLQNPMEFNKPQIDDTMLIRLGPKAWVCMFCQQQFTVGCSLKTHIRVVHFKEKRFACGRCGRRFGSNYNKTQHEKICKNEHVSVT